MVKRLTGERYVGHGGTLDPEAYGVLPICLGKARRIIEFLVEATKAYQTQIELGVATDTYDASGRITQRGDPSGIDRQQLEAAVNPFRGLIQQTPPMYSAVKHQGKRLYELARAGIEVERKSRSVNIYSLKITDWQPPLVTMEIVCSKGTYIRSLAHDLGQTLGCGAHLKNLLRSRCGLFDITDAISLTQFEDACRYGYWQQLVYPTDIVVSNWAAMVVSNDTGQLIRNGRPLILKTGIIKSPGENYCRVYTINGVFLGILHFDNEKGQWQPAKIFQ